MGRARRRGCRTRPQAGYEAGWSAARIRALGVVMFRRVVSGGAQPRLLSSGGRWFALGAVAALVVAATAALPSRAPREFRVCSDPNNLPFSNKTGEGFENKIAELFARDLDATVSY